MAKTARFAPAWSGGTKKATLRAAWSEDVLPQIVIDAGGALSMQASPGAGAAKLYFTPAGELAAKPSPGAGDRRVVLEAGALVAH